MSMVELLCQPTKTPIPAARTPIIRFGWLLVVASVIGPGIASAIAPSTRKRPSCTTA